MTETVLMVMPLIMIIAAVFQVFLLDAHVFRLATRSHADLFQRAFTQNRPDIPYDRISAEWNSSDQYVPVVGFFRPYGLTSMNMRIRSNRRIRRSGAKGIELGRGTAASVAAGLGGAATGVTAAMNTLTSELQRLDRVRQELEAQRNRPRR